MKRVRQFAILIGGTASALLFITMADASAASASPTLTTSSNSVLQNDSLTVSGAGCAQADASPTTVQVDLVNAFGDTGAIHTQDVAQGNAIPDASGNWSISIQVASSAESGPYDLLASCMNGTVPATWTAVFDYANGSIAVGASTTTSAPTTESTTEAVAPTSATSATSAASATTASSTVAATTAATGSSSTHTSSGAAVTSSSARTSAETPIAATSESQTTTESDTATSQPVSASPSDSTTTLSSGAVDAAQDVTTASSGLAFTGASATGFTGLGATLVLVGTLVVVGVGALLWWRRRGLHT